MTGAVRDRMTRIVLPGALLGLFALLAVGTARWMSCTFDESAHLTAGYAVARLGDYRFGPNHPPLIRVWSSLPNALDASVRFPVHEESYRLGRQHSTAFEFLHVQNSLEPLLFRGRLMVVALAAGLGLLIYRWTLRIAGAAAATAALTLFVFEPTLMAHGSLVTTDMGVTVFFFLTAAFLWLVWQRLTVPRLIGLGIFFALAQAAKFSALVLWPAVAAVLAWKALGRETWRIGDAGRQLSGRLRKLGVAAGVMVLLASIFLAVIWGAYGFRYQMAPAPGMPFDTTEDVELRVSEASMGERLGSIRILPEGYVRGVAQLVTWPQKPFYFARRIRDRALWYFYPAVLLLKTPTAVLLLGLVTAVLVARRRKSLPEGWPALAVPPAALLLAGMTSNVNTGVRHLLPLFPFMLTAAGVGAASLLADRRGRVVVAVLGLLTVGEFKAAYPDVLGAFNLPSGGPTRGDQWLLESDLDWGQGLNGLRRWMEDHHVEEINLACHTGLPENALGFRYRQLPVYLSPTERIDEVLLPGYVAASATVLRGLTLKPTGNADFHTQLRWMRPVARIGGSISVYYVDRPWWPSEDRARTLERIKRMSVNPRG